MPGIPASNLIPPAFDADRPEWIWEPKFLAKGKENKIFMTSEIFTGWRYFTLQNQVRLSKDYPENYEHEIGYAFKNGPGKKDKDGEPAENKAKPKKCWLFRGWIVEEQRMAAVVLDNHNIHNAIREIFTNPGYMLMDNNISNYYLTIKKSALENVQPQFLYPTTGALRPLQNPQAQAEAQLPFFPDNYWEGLNPLVAQPGQPAAPTAKPALPPTTHDENGAEREAEVPTEGDYVW